MFTHATGAIGGDYKAEADQQLVISVQIEHPNAVKEIDAILAEGVDVAFVSTLCSDEMSMSGINEPVDRALRPFGVYGCAVWQPGARGRDCEGARGVQEGEQDVRYILCVSLSASAFSSLVLRPTFNGRTYIPPHPDFSSALYLSRCAATSPQSD